MKPWKILLDFDEIFINSVNVRDLVSIKSKQRELIKDWTVCFSPNKPKSKDNKTKPIYISHSYWKSIPCEPASSAVRFWKPEASMVTRSVSIAPQLIPEILFPAVSLSGLG